MTKGTLHYVCANSSCGYFGHCAAVGSYGDVTPVTVQKGDVARLVSTGVI